MTPEGSRPALATALIALLALASARAAAENPEPDRSRALRPEEVERRLLDGVSPERARRTVADLVAFGPRMGGTPSGDKAAAYVKRRMQELGLDVEEILDSSKETHEEPGWEVRVIEPEPLALDAWPIGFSPALVAADVRILLSPRPEGGIDAPWALLTDAPPPSAMKAAAKAGAIAVLTDDPREEGRYVDWAPAVELSGRSAATVPGFTLSLNAGKRIRRWLHDGHGVRARLALDSRLSNGRPRTIVGTLPGARPGGYLVCAHGDSDSGGPGADDNASGVASLLEAASSMAKAAAEGLLPSPRSPVRFIVWGSEGYSTRDFVRTRPAEVGALLGVFNFDQTGDSTEKDALYFEGNDIPWNEGILRTLMSVAAEHAGRDGFPRQYTTNPALGGTDAYVFLTKEAHGEGLVTAKIPSTTVFTSAWGTPEEVTQTPGWQSPAWPERGKVRIDYDRYYHSSGDRPEVTTEPHADEMARCARAVALAILRLMS
jgi:hypothetical protein